MQLNNIIKILILEFHGLIIQQQQQQKNLDDSRLLWTIYQDLDELKFS